MTETFEERWGREMNEYRIMMKKILFDLPIEDLVIVERLIKTRINELRDNIKESEKVD